MIARISAAIMEPTIHLFLLILLDMELNTFLLLSIALSTSESCKKKIKLIVKHYTLDVIKHVGNIPSCGNVRVFHVDDANLQGLIFRALLSPAQLFEFPLICQLTDPASHLTSSIYPFDLQKPINIIWQNNLMKLPWEIPPMINEKGREWRLID